MSRLSRTLLLGLLLAFAGAATVEAKPHWRPDVAAAKRYAQKRAGEVAFATIDQRGRFRGYRVRDTAPAASVFKVMLLVALLRKRDEHPPASQRPPSAGADDPLV